MRKSYYLLVMLVLGMLAMMMSGATLEGGKKSAASAPIVLPGDPGVPANFDPASIPPIPAPPADTESGAKTDASPKTLVKATQPGPPVGSITQRTGALSGKFIYVNPGHGWTSGTSWATQRGLTNGMVEDHGNADQVCFFFIQYLQNAGATVIPIRDVGPMTGATIIDNDDASFTVTGTWSNSVNSPFWGDAADAVHYIYASTSATETATARWTPNITTAGYYPVFIWYRDGTDRATVANYRIVHKGGASQIVLNQYRVGKGWIWLGNYYFDAGTNGYVELTN